MFRVALSAAFLFAVGSIGYQPTANAQVLYGSLVGTVTDQAGASVPGANVRITSLGTTQSRETETDAEGNYTFPAAARRHL